MNILIIVVLAAVSVISARDINHINNLDIDVLSELPFEIDTVNSDHTTGCSIGVNRRNGWPNPQPLLLIPGTNQFLFPQTRIGVIRMYHQQQVELFCSGPAGFGPPFNGTQTLIATCNVDEEFIVNGRTLKFHQLACNEQVQNIARRSRRLIRNICQPTVTQIEVGFLVQDRFVWTMEICFNETLENTHYSYYKLGPEANGYQRNIDRPSFTGGIFFGRRNVDVLYTGFRQRQTIASIIGQQQVDKLWDNDRNFFFARGHLAARSDFIFVSQQRTSFYLMNAAPQWHSFNSGNWERIETSVQQFVSRRNINADVYTGTFGIQELPDANGVWHPLFLSIANPDRLRIPVPKYYYKILIGIRSRRGVAFVGVNNPHATHADIRNGKYRLCKDVSDRLDWVGWDRTNLTMGYSYACDVNELARVLGHLPAEVNTVGLLV